MSKANRLENISVNLIQQPVERAAIIMCLIGFVQFITYIPGGGSITPAWSWFLTAPILMAAAMIIAIRLNSNLPLLITFLSGAIAVVYFFNPELPSMMSFLKAISHNILATSYSPETNFHETHKSFVSLSAYSIVFWLLIRRFLQSRFFSRLQRFVTFNDIENLLAQKFERLMFITAFTALNMMLILSLLQVDDYSLISLSAAILFLFISGQHFSAAKRGFLLPIYITLLLASYLSLQTDTNIGFSLNSLTADVIIFVIWSFILWFADNYLSQTYNRIFTKLKISTTLWPLFGLFILIALLFEQALELIFQPAYIIILITYLFLMLRNTVQPLISWAIVLLLSWLVLGLGLTINSGLLHIDNLSDYAYQSILYCLSLLALMVVWERFLNQIFMRMGWHRVSFKKPILSVSLTVTIVCFLMNIVVMTGLLTAWFDLIHGGLIIEKTAALIIISFIILSLFINKQVLANLIHASLIFALFVLWGGTGEYSLTQNKLIPLYSLFAMIHLVWVLLPTLSRLVCHRLNLNYPENFIKTSANWIYISFVVTLMSLFSSLEHHLAGLESASFLFSVTILFVASLILLRRHANNLWLVFSYLLAAVMLISIRFMILGAVAVNAYDTAGILIISFILFALSRWNLLAGLSPNSGLDARNDSAQLVNLFPLTALFTIPWQTASLHSSLTLLVLGIFYLLIKKQSRGLFYSGFLFINLAIYTWMPLLSHYTNLMLFYVLPVSMSLIMIAHLHRNEMKPALQNKIRFIALSLLYLFIAADIFISSSLLLFFLGLLSGLLSAIYGISSKTRAFLFTGIAFIVINIIGQLIVFYPDDRLGRALILMATGVVITGLMIWFNIKREFLLSKIQLFRSDLDQWD